MRVYAWIRSHNVAGLAGPALVAAIAVVASPAWALTVLGVTVAATTVTSLGLAVTASSPEPPVAGRPIGAAVRLIATSPPLRAATLASTIAFSALGGLSFAVVSATRALGRPATDAGVVLAVAAVGGLAGSLAMTAVARRDGRRHPCSAVAATGGVLVVMGLGSWPVLLGGAFLIGFVDGLLVALFPRAADTGRRACGRRCSPSAASAKLGAASIGASPPPSGSTGGRPVLASSPSAESTSSPLSPGVSLRSGSMSTPATRHVARATTIRTET